ncbi:hypothetical protein BCR41DRAFT_65962 [Lobosporangium transversale]|uniref:Uncharacterized protein n=1 Tax=Lobosporangium transversale TaxID=64571 RepID=A0A1Y2GMF4_9FUNG|nr:hypothetical protein BCR41DRAFT_65962 [Lobosporangium transversale]ORZ15570.1 hypothetical protein BCR41DRAFT_65962 [Lobosporangium transversale]|eukprot:XP_021881318.1 hypothetical protein BCR41DRAFT_65962 [Lobosporangium transversale]
MPWFIVCPLIFCSFGPFDALLSVLFFFYEHHFLLVIFPLTLIMQFSFLLSYFSMFYRLATSFCKCFLFYSKFNALSLYMAPVSSSSTQASVCRLFYTTVDQAMLASSRSQRQGWSWP